MRVRINFCFFFVSIYQSFGMQNSMVLWLCFVVTSLKASMEYDGLINSLTRVFVHKHVQTVTATTSCWPTGDNFLFLSFSHCRFWKLIITPVCTLLCAWRSLDANNRLLFALSSADISVNFHPSVIPVHNTWYRYGILVDVSCVQIPTTLFRMV